MVRKDFKKSFPVLIIYSLSSIGKVCMQSIIWIKGKHYPKDPLCQNHPYKYSPNEKLTQIQQEPYRFWAKSSFSYDMLERA